MKKHFLSLVAITMMIATTIKAQKLTPFFMTTLSNPSGVAFDKAGNLYVANWSSNGYGYISKVSSSGAVSVFVDSVSYFPYGTNNYALAFDNGGILYVADIGNGSISKATSSGSLSTFVSGLNSPSSIAFDNTGNLYVTNGNFISKVTSSGAISTFVSGLNSPPSLAFNTGNLYVINGNSISKVTSSGAVSTFVSGLKSPSSLAFDNAGNLYVANWSNNGYGNISKVSSGGSVSTFVNSGVNYSTALAIDNVGNLYVTNQGGNSVSKVISSGVVSTFVAGLSNASSLAFDTSGDLYVAEQLQYGSQYNYNSISLVSKITSNSVMTMFVDSGLNNPSALTFDKAGNLYVANQLGNFANSSISKITSNGVVSTFADSLLYNPTALAFDNTGNLFVANGNNYSNSISKVTSGGIVSNFVLDSSLALPGSLAFDKVGNLYVAANGISKVTSNGIVSTVVSYWVGDTALVIDNYGNLYVANQYDNSIIKITNSGVVSTFIDSGLNVPSALALDKSGNLYVISGGHNIYKISINTLPVTLSSFTAVTDNKVIEIEWQTSTELNTSHFIIQHSTDGTSFTDIGNVKAIGSRANEYQFTDNNPANGTNYYRLQSVDKDGSSSYSKVVSVNFGGKQAFSIVPNPARDFATISFSKTVDKATIAVYDITGKAVITQSVSGTNAYKLNTQTLTNGVYVIKVNTTTGSYNEKLLINK